MPNNQETSKNRKDESKSIYSRLYSSVVFLLNFSYFMMLSVSRGCSRLIYHPIRKLKQIYLEYKSRQKMASYDPEPKEVT